MALGHGGARPGSGRKPKTADAAEPGQRFDTALELLEAVVRGDLEADTLTRIAAARVVLPYQAPKARAPVESPPPKVLRAKTERSADRAETDDWQRRAAEVRRRLKDKT